MSAKYPIISVTGSSGAGTTSVRRTFEQIFRRERIAAAFIEGDAFHRYNRDEMRAVMAEEELKGNRNFSHFGANANLLEELEAVFRSYSESGTGKTRHYVHGYEEAAHYGCAPETFTDWEALPEKGDLLFYEGLHGAVKTDKVNISQYPRLEDRRRPGNQPRMDSKNPSGLLGARLYSGRGHGHDVAANARLYPLHVSPVHRNGHQFPEGSDGRYLKSLRCALDPDRR